MLNRKNKKIRKTESIFEEATRITSKDRQKRYGPPRNNLANTASLWTAFLNRKYGAEFVLTARDVALLQILLKISRDANKPSRENLVDICGYVACAESLMDVYD